MQIPELGKTTWFATAARGTERFLIGELKAFGAENIEDVPGGVWFDGPYEVALRCCLWSRIASRVMAFLGRAEVASEDGIYEAFRSLPLRGWFDPDKTVACKVKSRGEYVKNSHFAALRMKDAVCDHVRDETGRRPNVDLENPDVTIAATVRGSTVHFFVELQGDTLNQRGYRRQSADAPLRESLSAAFAMFSGWRGTEPLQDFLCGSGTILIEAIWLATDTAPGTLRTFGFEKFHWFDEIEQTWTQLREEAQERRLTALPHAVIGSDVSPSAIRIAKRNARLAGVGDLIEFQCKPFSEVERFENGGMFIGNPPYGERLLDDEEAVALHEEIDAFAYASPGHRLCLITQPELLKHCIKLKPERVLDTFNGSLPVRMALYDIHER